MHRLRQTKDKQTDKKIDGNIMEYSVYGFEILNEGAEISRTSV